MNYRSHIIKTFLAKIFLAVISIVSSMIIARVLGPTGKGEYTIVLLISSMVVSLGSFNIGESAIYFHNKRKVEIGTIISSNGLFVLFSSATYILVIVSLSLLGILPWKELNKPNMKFFVCLLIPLIFLYRYSLDVLRSQEKYDAYNLLLLIRPISYLLFVLVFVWLINAQVLGALISCTFTFITLVVLASYFVFRRSKIDLKPKLRYLQSSLFYGLKGHIGNIFYKFNMRWEQFLITPYWNSAMLGNYSVAVTLSELIFYLPDSLGVVLLPRLAQERKSQAMVITARALRVTIPLTLLAIAACYVSAKAAVLIIYGRPFMPAATAIYFMLPGMFFLTISKVLSNYFSGRGHPEINTYTSGFSSISTVILCILLIPKYAIIGAAIASSLSHFVRAFFDVFFFLRFTKGNIFQLFIPTLEDMHQLVLIIRLSASACLKMIRGVSKAYV